VHYAIMREVKLSLIIMFNKKMLLSLCLALGLVFSACTISIGDDDDKIEPQIEEEPDSELEKLKEELEEKEKELEELKEGEDEDEEEEEDEDEITDLEEKIEEAAEEEEEEAVVEAYDGPNYITLNSPSDEERMTEEPISFTGSVSPNTTKVVATAEYGTKDCGEGMCLPYNEDVYRLQKFNYGDESYTYRAKEEYNNLSPHGSNDFTFTAYFDDGSTKSVSVTIFYAPGGAEMGKPVIYLYPEKTQKVSVNVEPNDGISISDPELGDGWEVIATPDSKIYNFGDGKVYPYLFWEGWASDFETPEEGFVVEEREVASFFDQKLRTLGLNKKETADFKEFWVPYLSGDDYYFITFIDQAAFDKYAPLTVTPEPDSVIRVFFDYKVLEEPIKVVEQQFETPERNGFTLVEWGGRLHR
jgi:hypothetical protein